MFESLFGSRTRVKLLSHFLTQPDQSFYVRELTRSLGEQINSIRRELANLEALGIVKSEHQGHKLYYRVNPRYSYLQELSSLFRKAKDRGVAPASEPAQTADDLTRRLAALGSVQLALLAGVFLGKQAVVDLLLVGDINKVKLSKFLAEQERELGREINFTVMTAEEYHYRRSLYDRFLGEVLDSDKMVMIDRLGAARNPQETV
jgi:DNA-binding transcriptional ArsR family regulator